MKEFTSSNGLKMVVGKLFNWKVEQIYRDTPNPIGYAIYLGGLSEMYCAFYLPDEKELSFSKMKWSSDDVCLFYCEDIYVAETFVEAFIKGNEFEIKGTIYEKQ